MADPTGPILRHISKLRFSSYALCLALCLPNLAMGSESAHSSQPAGSVIEGQALATTAGGSSGVLILSIDPDNISVLKALSSSIIDGALDKFRLGEGGFVSANLSQHLSINPGDFITLVHPTGQSSPIMGPTPLVIRYRVLGVVDSALLAAAGETVYIRRADAEKFSKLENE
ncbi:hypothetical protein [Agrobacterium rosae]|uniref:hypothetical protein n=1 Tax=Agrobacterium rosae TaxID=1972867 RepID=UPI003A7FE848